MVGGKGPPVTKSASEHLFFCMRLFSYAGTPHRTPKSGFEELLIGCVGWKARPTEKAIATSLGEDFSRLLSLDIPRILLEDTGRQTGGNRRIDTLGLDALEPDAWT